MRPPTTDIRLRDRALAHVLPTLPRSLVRRVSRPYIAGNSLDDAIRTVEQLAAGGMTTTVDVLGESIRSLEEARATCDEYLRLIARLAQLGKPDLVNVSVKLTAFGIELDQTGARAMVTEIVAAAAAANGFVRIDMEDSPWTDVTLDLYRALRNEGFTNVGVVIQSYLRRSENDVAALAREGARVRVVKGIYVEPADVAFSEMREINDSYLRLCATLLEAGCHVAFATHDEELVEGALKLVREAEPPVPKDRYEFQMLLGVREPMRDALVRAGEPVRIYVPYGARWYEYSIRRLRENPRVAGLVAADVARAARARVRRLGRSRR
jgi:proline dehydrogenase